MAKFLLGVLVTLIILAAAGAATIYSGVINVGADVPHSPLVYRVLDTARERSIERQAKSLEVPTDLDDPERIRRGAGNYDAMCVACHLSPGVENSEIRAGLYPVPPNLAKEQDEASASEQAIQFWVIKHGVKASGMPAWSKGGMDDASIWDLVAFIEKLPTLSPTEYRALVDSSDGHSHGGMDGHHDHAHESETPSAAKSGNAGEQASPGKKKPHNHDGHTH